MQSSDQFHQAWLATVKGASRTNLKLQFTAGSPPALVLSRLATETQPTETEQQKKKKKKKRGDSALPYVGTTTQIGVWFYISTRVQTPKLCLKLTQYDLITQVQQY